MLGDEAKTSSWLTNGDISSMLCYRVWIFYIKWKLRFFESEGCHEKQWFYLDSAWGDNILVEDWWEPKEQAEEKLPRQMNEPTV